MGGFIQAGHRHVQIHVAEMPVRDCRLMVDVEACLSAMLQS